MIPPAIQTEIESFLSKRTRYNVKISSSFSIGGGCINDASRIETTAGNYFVKYNLVSKYPDMFEKEALGLKLLASAQCNRVPEVIFHGIAGDYSFLMLEFINQGARIQNFWDDFGHSLAVLHRQTAQSFGLDHNNYMGSLQQSNRFHPDWYSFFITERLEPQVKFARDSGELSASAVKSIENLYNLLPGIVPPESPALLHGDLWNGNFMVSEEGRACLIDPAAYYGHRETDIAMTKLFGGFSEEFYSAYNSAFLLEKGWQQRIDILNLYPLLIHVNLFGGGYASQVVSIIRRF
jgi:protein-ribulosamine 3-kinase